MESTKTTSCQVAVPKQDWIRFRQMCLFEGISASAKVRQLVVTAVSSNELGTNQTMVVFNKLEERGDE